MTAVEWLIQEHFGGIENCTPDFRNKIEQAKEIEKNQIMDAFHEGCQWGYEQQPYNPEEYYKETFKTE